MFILLFEVNIQLKNQVTKLNTIIQCIPMLNRNTSMKAFSAMLRCKMVNKTSKYGTFSHVLCLFNIPPSNRAMTVHGFCCSDPLSVGFAANIRATFVTLIINTKKNQQVASSPKRIGKHHHVTTSTSSSWTNRYCVTK